MESARADLAPARRARAAFYTAETERRLLRQRHRSGGVQTVMRLLGLQPKLRAYRRI
jgi:hypothetical protein